MIANISLIINTLEAYVLASIARCIRTLQMFALENDNENDDNHNIVRAKFHFVTLVRDVTFRRGKQILRDPAARQKEYRIT